MRERESFIRGSHTLIQRRRQFKMRRSSAEFPRMSRTVETNCRDPNWTHLYEGRDSPLTEAAVFFNNLCCQWKWCAITGESSWSLHCAFQSPNCSSQTAERAPENPTSSEPPPSYTQIKTKLTPSKDPRQPRTRTPIQTHFPAFHTSWNTWTNACNMLHTKGW